MVNTRKTTGAARTSTRKRKKKAGRTRKPALARIEAELPATLRAFSLRMRRGLAHLENRIDKDGREARRRGARMLREASYRLGRLEAQGEREWRRQSLRVRRATVRLLRQLERTIEPPRKARRRKPEVKPSADTTASTSQAGLPPALPLSR